MLPEFTLTISDLRALLGDERIKFSDTEVWFTPNIDSGELLPINLGLYNIGTVHGIINELGQLEDLDGNPGVTLLANDPILNLEIPLQWQVEFRKAKINGFQKRIDSWWFTAPEAGQVVDLVSLAHVVGTTATGTTTNYVIGVGNGQVFYNIGAVSDSYSVDLADGTIQECTLTPSYSKVFSDYPFQAATNTYGPNNCVFTLPAIPAGTTLTLIVKQPIVGVGYGRWAVVNASFPGVIWKNGATPFSTLALRTADVFTFTSDGTTIWGDYTQGHIYHPPYDYARPLVERRGKGSANPTLYYPTGGGLQFLTPRDVATAYGIPLDELDGTGVTVGCVQLEGPPDIPMLQAYCNYMGINKTLDIEVIYMPGAESQASQKTMSVECALDMCVLTSLLPGAKHKVYVSLNNWDATLEVQKRALDECDLVSYSWLGTELGLRQGLSNDLILGRSLEGIYGHEQSLREARSRGVSFFVSSGDFGSDVWGPGYWNRALTPWHENPRTLGVPANCPSAVSVGMTALHLDENGIRTSEEAYMVGTESSTGGYSYIFPDTMCPVVSCFGYYSQGFFIVLSNRTWVSYSSTSGSCPFMAAVHAKMIQLKGHRFDFMNFALANPGAFHDITTGLLVTPGIPINPATGPTATVTGVTGTNGAFNTKVGRDLVTGIGSPNWPAMVAALENWNEVGA